MERELLYKFFKGTASLEEGMKVKKWQESSEENKRAFYRERRLFDTVILNCAQADASIRKQPKNLRFLFAKLEWLKIASVVVFTLGISYLYQQYNSRNLQPKMSLISVPAGQRVSLLLPDGTSVWLNANSTMQYPASFDSKQRTVILRGEAFFDVAKDKKHPFVVQTENYAIEVLGTTFNVNAYPDKDDFETALMQGSVNISSIINPSRKITLAPKQKVYLNKGELTVANINDYDHYLWRNGLICFRDQPFADIMREFEKCYGIDIVINNKKVEEYYYTGKFRQTDGVDYALRILQGDLHFHYKKDNDNQIIYIE